VSRQDNAKNKGKAKRQGITSQFKGVSLIKSTGAWRATITIDGKNTNLGHYATERDAAIAYDIAAVKYHGEFAALNFPETASENEPPKVFVSPRGKSQYMGVTWYDRYGKWLARIGKGNQRRFLGYFDLENEAARAYNAAALELYGHRARLNEIFETEAV
jgi:hypothetical protein